MPDRAPIWIAIAGGSIVSCGTFAVLGWNAPAAHAAARNTARFSALCYIVAMASPGLFLLSSRFAKPSIVSREFRFPKEFRLVQAFVAAHMVHFATVSVVIAAFGISRYQKNPIASAIQIAGVFAITAALGLTAGRTSRWQIILHQILFYLFFVIFLGALTRSLVPRLLDVLLVAALVLRIMSKRYISAAEGLA